MPGFASTDTHFTVVVLCLVAGSAQAVQAQCPEPGSLSAGQTALAGGPPADAARGAALRFQAVLIDRNSVATYGADGEPVVVPGRLIALVEGGRSARSTHGATMHLRVKGIPSEHPRAVGSIPAQSIAPGQTFKLDISEYFYDPDNDRLTYAATTTDAGIASPTISCSTLTIAGVAPGVATVKVMARDPDDLSAEHTIEVTIPQPRPWWPLSGNNWGIDPRLLAISGHYFVQTGETDPGEVRIFGNKATELDFQLVGVDFVGYINDGKGRVGINAGMGFANMVVDIADTISPSDEVGGNSSDSSGTATATNVIFLSTSFFFQFGNYLRLNVGRVKGISTMEGLDAKQRDDSAWMIGVSLSTVLEEAVKDGLSRLVSSTAPPGE